MKQEVDKIVRGTANQPFKAIREIFAQHLESGLDIGASLCIYHRGQPVVSLWGGETRPGLPWQINTLVPLTSITKIILAAIALVLAQKGSLDIDAPICRYWPEFAASGKENVSLRCVLAHRAGLPVFDRPITLADQIERKSLIRNLASMQPLWPPNTIHGYHAITFGFLVSEVIYRATGVSPRLLAEQILLSGLQADVHFSLRPNDICRVATIVPPPEDEDSEDIQGELAAFAKAITDPTSLTYRATFGSTKMTFADMNDLRYYTADRPAAYGTADGVARFLASLIRDIDSGRLLDQYWMEQARAVESDGTDEIFKLRTTWGLGFLLPGGPLMPNIASRVFGHIGSTGGIAFADPEADLALAFLPSKMKSIFELPDTRSVRFVEKVYECI